MRTSIYKVRKSPNMCNNEENHFTVSSDILRIVGNICHLLSLFLDKRTDCFFRNANCAANPNCRKLLIGY